MKRREFLKIAGTGLASFAAGAFAAERAKASGRSLEGSRPNIVLVMTDDQGYGDLACHGHPYVRTPNIDRFYAQSTRFTDFQVSPTCSPTRSGLMSGKLPFEVGITHTILERERMSLKAKTVAQALKEAGYTTGIFGKWHLGDEDPYQPDRRGFDEVFIHGGGGIGQSYPGSCADAPGNKYFDPTIKHNGTFEKTHGFCTDVFFRQALGWIKANRRRRFFAYIPTNAAHGPFTAPDKYLPYYLKHTKDKKRAAFYGMIENIDDNFGLLLRKLEEWGLAENTLVIFMTDNGTSKGDYNAGMKGRKGSPHEGGTHVPAFFRWPGKIKAGVDISHLARHVDIFPTFAALAGASTPPDLAGRSLLPLLENPEAPWPDRYTFFHTGRWGKKGVPRWNRGNCDPDKAKYRGFAVRTERFRLVGKKELYDVKNDPSEKENVIDRYPETARKMLSAYEAWWKKIRPLLINEDVPLAKTKPFVELYYKQKREKGIPDWVPPDIS